MRNVGLIEERPDRVLIYGDTNSTLAGALAAAKLTIPVAHVEAGMRSFRRAMPEEVNRVVADHLSDLLLCSSQMAVNHLAKEGITQGVHLVGDVMGDVLLAAAAKIGDPSGRLEALGLVKGEYLLVTVHRPRNTDDDSRLRSILEALAAVREAVVFPIHSRTRKAIQRLSYTPPPSVHLIDPVSYLEMVRLEQSARMILTDSGGVQKEAYWLGVPCLTLREETEWVETVELGWNRLVGADPVLIRRSVRDFRPPPQRPPLYGQGQASERCCRLLTEEAD